MASGCSASECHCVFFIVGLTDRHGCAQAECLSKSLKKGEKRSMAAIICLLALGFLILFAYRGYSVILFAPIAALGAVLLTQPSSVLPVYSGLFMDSMVVFVKNYFPAFMLGAIFGKVIELSGFAKSIVHSVIIVVVFAVYPFAAELFRASNIPKRLIPGTIALGSFTFTMDCLPFTPQIQNIIPTRFFGTTAGAAGWLGTIGAVWIFIWGMLYLEWRRRAAAKAGEGYGTTNLVNEPEPVDT